MHRKAKSKVFSKIITAAVLFGLLSAGFIAAPTGPAHASVSPPITSCTITDGVTSQSVWPLNIPLDALSVPSAQVTMVPTPATGAFVSAPIGFAKLDGSQWVQIAGGTGLATDPGYQPPGPGAFQGDTRDAGSSALSFFNSRPQYPRSEWGFEYRYYAATTDPNGYNPASQPLCVIRVVATDPVLSGQSAVTIPGGTTAIGAYAASRSVTWSVVEYGPADIQISPSGVLSFVTAPAPRTYEAWVNATDASGNVFERKVDITVLAAQAPGTTGTPTAVAGNGSATVTIVAPSSGGTPVSYLVTASNGATCTVTVPATSCTVTGLTNGTAYTFTSRATNAGGTSAAASAASNAVTPLAPPGIPGTPTAVAGNGSATVSVVAPSSGGTVTSYTVTAAPGGATCTVTPPATFCVVSGLTNGTSYTFTSTATNSGLTSAASASSNSVTPSAPASGGSAVIFRSVSFDANGGVGSGVAVSHAGGTPIPGNAFTRAGHVFTGWNTKQDGSGVTYTNAGTYAFNSDMTLFAQWVPVKAAVKANRYISNFAGDRAALSPRMRTSVASWVRTLPRNAVITCQGSTSGSRVTAFDRRLAQNRAKNVCNEAVKIRSDLKFSIKLNPSSANKASARHVLLIQN